MQSGSRFGLLRADRVSRCVSGAALNYCVDFGLGTSGVCLGSVMGDSWETVPVLTEIAGTAACLPMNEPLFGVPLEDVTGALVPCGSGDTCADGYQCTDFSGAAPRGCYVVERVCQVLVHRLN